MDIQNYINEGSVQGNIIKSASNAIVITDLANNITYGNPAFLEMWGFAHSNEFTGKPFNEFCIAEQGRTEMYNALQARGKWSDEIRARRNNGSLFDIHISAAVIRENEGDPVGYIFSCIDITDRKRAELEHQITEARFRSLIKHTEEGFCLLEPKEPFPVNTPVEEQIVLFYETKIIECNDVIAEMNGFSCADDIIGMELNEFWNEKNTSEKNDIIIAYINSNYNLVNLITNRNFPQIETKWYSNHVLGIIENDSLVRTWIIQIDITKNRLVESALRENENRLNEAQRIAKIGSWDLDVTTNKLSWSDEVYRIFGFEPKQFKANYDFFLEMIHPEDRKMVDDVYVNSVNKREPYEVVHRILMEDGSIKYVNERCETFYDKNGNAVRSIGTVQDITERKVAEVQIKQSLKEKEILIKELYHRSKNNMQVISSMLCLKSENIHDKSITDMFNDIVNKIYSMSYVHQKLYESGDLSHLNLKDYIEGLIEHLKTGSPDNLIFSFKGENVNVLLDTAMPCGLVLNELISNSIQHAFTGINEAKIDITMYVSLDCNIILEYSDNGIGLPADFDVVKNTSLGMQTIINLITNQLQGEIVFEDRDGFFCRIILKEECYKERV